MHAQSLDRENLPQYLPRGALALGTCAYASRSTKSRRKSVVRAETSIIADAAKKHALGPRER